ncbi:probable serine hydrolase [Ceratitis capitata]|uniref:(Mediterranean fruit fly) hypothetical protein n=2 Tax=Ceratitis capitata TaxID=7213 RepID=A0A811UUR1_CERCA|nr:probable serine hydrolase [Ceratitis capitata]CAD7002922.1 unnamed protein product [Ceratitis capitata]
MVDQRATKFTEIQIPVPWGHVCGRWYGNQSIPPLIALHGWLDNCGTFAKLAPLIAEAAGSVLCIDLPGHGHSSHLPVGILYDNLEFVRILMRLMKAYNWTKISLMGHSMGGAIGFYFASLHPSKVDLLISIDVVLRRFFKPNYAVEALKYTMSKALLDNQRLVDATPLQEPPSYTFAECERLLYEGSGRSMLLENCKYILERNLSRSKKFPQKYYFSRDTRLKYLIDLNPEEVLSKAMAKRISDAEIPFMVIRGGASTNIDSASKELIRFLSEHNKNFETHLIADGTHHFHLDQPVVVANMIIPFLKRYRPLTVLEAQQQQQQQLVGIKGELLPKGKL